MDEEQEKQIESTIYVCAIMPNLNISCDVGTGDDKIRRMFAFKNTRLELFGEDAIAFTKMLEKNSPLRQKIQVVDRKAAEAIALAHMKANKQGGPISGTMTSDHMKRLENLEARDAALLKETGSPAAANAIIDELEKDSLTMTVKAAQPDHSLSSGQRPAEPAKAAEGADAKLSGPKSAAALLKTAPAKSASPTK